MTPTSDLERVIGLRAAAQAALSAGRDDEARARFAEASQLCSEVLLVTDPVRLAVAGDHAEAWFERWRDAETAFEIARTAYDDAVFAMDGVTGDRYREAVRELAGLRDRMTFWAFTMESS